MDQIVLQSVRFLVSALNFLNVYHLILVLLKLSNLFVKATYSSSTATAFW